MILDAAFKVHTKSGPGLLETVYEVLLAHELRKQELHVERQMPIRIYYDELLFDEGFRASLRPWRPLRELAGARSNRRISREGRKGRKGKGAKPEIAIRQNHLYGKSNETKLDLN
jgi:hypothetical protein